MASPAGIRQAGFPDDYPAPATTIAQTQGAAARWHATGREGLVCRSHALYEVAAERGWHEPHEPWGEVAIFVRNTKAPISRRAFLDLSWLEGRLVD